MTAFFANLPPWWSAWRRAAALTTGRALWRASATTLGWCCRSYRR